MPVKKLPASPRLRGASKTTIHKVAKVASKSSKFSVPVYGLSGVKKGTVELPREIFGTEVNEKLMAQAVRV